MVKETVKRYVAMYVSKNVEKGRLKSAIEKGFKDYLGVLYPSRITQIKYVKRFGKAEIFLFRMKKGFDPHIIIPILSLIKIDNCWIEPILMSGTLKSLQESLKIRYPKLAQG